LETGLSNSGGHAALAGRVEAVDEFALGRGGGGSDLGRGFRGRGEGVGGELGGGLLPLLQHGEALGIEGEGEEGFPAEGDAIHG
jgi:hypothetical protein